MKFWNGLHGTAALLFVAHIVQMVVALAIRIDFDLLGFAEIHKEKRH